jgi:hypothetical protein
MQCPTHTVLQRTSELSSYYLDIAGLQAQLSILALALSFPAWASDLPDPVLTPGAFNLSVTQENIQQTVCVNAIHTLPSA